MKTKLKILKIIYDSSKDSLEYRIFNTISLASALLMILLIPINYAQNMSTIHIIALSISAIITLVIFVLFRYRNIKLISLSLIIAILILTTLWFTNGGSYGSIPYYFTFTLACSIILLRGKKRNIFFLINIIVVVSLIIIEYYNKESIIYYNSLKDRYIDIMLGITICLFMLGIIIKIVIDNFDAERKKVEQNTLELEKRNQSLLNKNIEITEKKNQLIQVLEELKKNEERIKYLAYHDMLTDLPNRRLGKEILQLAIDNHSNKSSKIGVLFLDLDRFKYINDILGHDIGDFLLKNVSERLKICVRESDTVVRLGGDEFMIIVDEPCSFKKISNISQQIIDIFSEPFILETRQINITCSIGIAIFPEHGKNIETLLKNADIAMYQAKEKGRNNFKFFSHEVDEKINKDMEIREGIIKAIEKKEFVLYYQPKIDIKSGKLAGSEALVRWNHPQQGLIYPSDFIPIAEQYGLINNIDKLVLEMACNQIKKWVNKGFDPGSVSINISANQFNDLEFIDMLDSILSKTEINHRLIQLEITETAAMQDTSYTQKVFYKIKKRGINIALDDFGTGYSSLNYLKSFPIDVLKIDKSFVDEICSNKVDNAIILAAITMAKALDIKVVAEGVETNEQLELLKDADCQEYQGYLFSKPVSVEEMEMMFIKNGN
ncbi:putative bifunctional diguanylate cyclase/phosphodiesterase [Tepidibacter sp. Z1-5]|uniref:putative bifunctional diguanylate cyclase/phosphodiesterase n=1 Tax=Tepidibacter sp. Z1-5 TaxID=3134138 RepID=UPI0030C3024E